MDLTEKLAIAKEEGKKLGYWRHGLGYRRRAYQIFGGAEMAGKTLLEIGCGNGVYCLWASIHGAKHVVGLEPLVEGSFDTPKCFTDFATMVKAVGLRDTEIIPALLQNYQAPPGYFDYVLSRASINHLDEQSCINLRNNLGSYQAYQTIFTNIGTMMRPGGKLIVVDCSPRNLYGEHGITNPFLPTIEWFKHQTPEVWAELFAKCGFSDFKISWLSGSILRNLGIYSMPKVMSYCLRSFFRLEATYTSSPSAK